MAALTSADLEWIDASPGLHPLVFPIAREASGTILGLLRWPTAPPSMPMPVVRAHGTQLERLARSVDEWLHRELVVRESRREPYETLLARCNQDSVLYRPGSLAESGLPLKAYLLTQVGVSFSFFEELAEAHLERGDLQAALVTADRATREPEGWGRPTAFRALLLHRLGKYAEARDAARTALHEPLWTFGPHSIEAVGHIAGWDSKETALAHFQRLVQDSTRPPLDRAAHALDVATMVGEFPPELPSFLSALYEAGGYPDVATWLTRPSEH